MQESTARTARRSAHRTLLSVCYLPIEAIEA